MPSCRQAFGSADCLRLFSTYAFYNKQITTFHIITGIQIKHSSNLHSISEEQEDRLMRQKKATHSGRVCTKRARTVFGCATDNEVRRTAAAGDWREGRELYDWK
ncbi:hypothetical protein ACLOJK_023374 [Asimina triloba]